NLPHWNDATSHCSHCAKIIKAGDLYGRIQLAEFFSDTRDLAAPNGIICWACIYVRKKVLLNGLSRAVITQDGVYPIAQAVHKAWLFTNPPEPPFVAVHT